jgi:hypothetical protein
VYRDSSGIPHIVAENAHDLFFAQGFVTAQDRLWAMESARRAAHASFQGGDPPGIAVCAWGMVDTD